MISNKERIIEWLTRSKNFVHDLRKKPRLSKEKKLNAIRQSYSILTVLIRVAEGKAELKGIPPPNIP